MSGIRSEVDRILQRTSFLLSATVAIAGPWLFGAWEPWWFWVFATCLFLSLFLSGVGMVLRGVAQHESEEATSTSSGSLCPQSDEGSSADGPGAGGSRVVVAVATAALVYVFIRNLQVPVRLDAERSLLLFLLPVALSAQVAFVFSPDQRRSLFVLVAANFLLLGLYGIVNHWVTGSRWVLWLPGYEQYQIGMTRATGSYFCPDHFAGIMELGLAVGLAFLLSRGHGWKWHAAGGVLSIVALIAIVMSKSRGAAFVVVAMLLAAVAFGLYQRSALKRWCWRVSILAGAAIVAGLVWHAEPSYVKRFKAYFGKGPLVGETWGHKVEALRQRLEPSDRYQMIGAALRGWKMAPVFGIGPGMHQHYWPHNAATGDGDRATNRWPRYTNSGYHSYEAHSDWAQLLEEYGLVGFLLVVCGAVAILAFLARSLLDEGRRFRRGARHGATRSGMDPYALPLAGLLALVAMCVHSFGDFNLQMPATGWVLAVMVGIPLARNALDAKERAAAVGKREN